MAVLGAERQLPVHLVAVAPPVAQARQVAVLLQLGDDPLRGALGDADVGGDVAEPRARIGVDAAEDERVICHKGP